MKFVEGAIDGVVTSPLQTHRDRRGWLVEFFRNDEMKEGELPVMGYVSETLPGIARGPHEHRDQTDYFCFIGPSTFKLYLWDHRAHSPTAGRRMVLLVGEDHPLSVIIPPGVVHAYRNVGAQSGIVYNFANRLYAGRGRKEPVDEIRHEDNPDSPFQLD